MSQRIQLVVLEDWKWSDNSHLDNIWIKIARRRKYSHGHASLSPSMYMKQMPQISCSSHLRGHVRQGPVHPMQPQGQRSQGRRCCSQPADSPHRPSCPHQRPSHHQYVAHHDPPLASLKPAGICTRRQYLNDGQYWSAGQLLITEMMCDASMKPRPERMGGEGHSGLPAMTAACRITALKAPLYLGKVAW